LAVGFGFDSGFSLSVVAGKMFRRRSEAHFWQNAVKRSFVLIFFFLSMANYENFFDFVIQ